MKNPENKPKHNRQMFLSRGRPRKTIALNRAISVDFETYKLVLALIKDKKSLRAIQESTNVDMKLLRAIRKFGIQNNFITKKNRGNTKRAETIRRRKLELEETNSRVKEIMVFRVTTDDLNSPNLEHLEETLVEDTINMNQFEESSIVSPSSPFLPVSPVSPVSESSQTTESVEALPTSKVITIDFKGILIKAEVSSIVVTDDIIIVR